MGRHVAAVLGVALLLAWPALLNGFPILFSDTNAFLVQATRPWVIWDKPFVYGPFLEALHGFTTLWVPVAAQTLIVSVTLRLATLTVAPAAPPAWHWCIGLALAAGSALPWVASLLMPDIFAPLTVLALFVLAVSESRAARRFAGLLASFAIAAHLSHLVIAAACVAALAPFKPRRVTGTCVPILAALAFLVASNVVGFGRLAVSPFGSVFLLARLVADEPAREVIAAGCPHAGWRLCAWVGRLPANSDAFLWSPHGPVWSDPGGPKALAAEADVIVRRTILAHPGAVLAGALRNTAAQLAMLRLGDTLGPENLSEVAATGLHRYFPAAERARFAASLQAHDRLRAWATALNPLHAACLLLGALAAPFVFVRRHRALSALTVAIVAGIVANAAATGALSGPHDRYQARIAWLLLLPPLLAAAAWSVRSAPVPRPGPAPSGPVSRNPATVPRSPGRG